MSPNKFIIKIYYITNLMVFWLLEKRKLQYFMDRWSIKSGMSRGHNCFLQRIYFYQVNKRQSGETTMAFLLNRCVPCTFVIVSHYRCRLARYTRFAARAPAIHGHGNYVGLIYRFRPYVLICVDRWCIAMGRRLHHRYIVLGFSL